MNFERATVQEENGETPLLFAALTGRHEIAEHLLRMGAKVNAHGKVRFTCTD
jgi:hypothetical protein